MRSMVEGVAASSIFSSLGSGLMPSVEVVAAPSTAFGGPPPTLRGGGCARQSPLPGMRSSVRASAAVLVLLAISAPARAQMWAGMGPRGVAMPGVTLPGVNDFAARAVRPTQAAPAPAPVAAATTVLRHLPAPLDGWRISGESGELRWPVFLTQAQVVASPRLRIGYMSAVSVLPETSSLRLRINGRVVGADPIDAPQGLRRIAFTIPADLLKPGFNEVAIIVEQRHRVDCSVAATFELWTRIDPAETGLELPAAAASITDLADLPALASRPDGAVPIHVVLSGRTNPSHLGRLVRATQALALRGRMQQPIVDFSQDAGEPYGLDLALGTREALVKLPRLAGALGTTGPLVVVIAGDTSARPTLVVTGSDDREVDAAIAGLSRLPEPFGTAAGLVAAANFPARLTQGGEALTMHDLGLATQDFNGRFFKRSIAFSLPADMLVADYGRGTFDLAGGYASGLARGAQVRVDVNGHNSGIIKLPYADGEVFKHNQLFLPLGMMRPGVNRVDIYAETPREADASCAASPAKRFLFIDKSQLRLPTLARVERLPDLALATAGALPFTQGQAHLVVPKPDRDTMGAALSLTARVAVAANRIVPFAFATKMPATSDGSTLVVSPARSLDPGTMTRVGLDPAAVEAAWRNVADTRQVIEAAPGAVQAHWWLTNPDGPSACKLPPHAAVAIKGVVKSAPATAKDDDILDQAAGETQAPGWRIRLGEWADTVQARFRMAAAGSGAAGVDADASLLMAQGVTGGDGDVTTIVTASDAATLKASVGCLFDPQVWSKVHGRLAALDASTGNVVASDATSFTYRGAKASSLGNGRLVLAGWFSLNPLAFVAMSLLLALCLSGTTLWFVRGVGRRPE